MKKKILSMVAVLLMAVTAQAQEDYIVVKYDGARPNILDFVTAILSQDDLGESLGNMADNWELLRDHYPMREGATILSDVENGYVRFDQRYEDADVRSHSYVEICYWNCSDNKHKLVAINNGCEQNGKPVETESTGLMFYRYDNTAHTLTYESEYDLGASIRVTPVVTYDLPRKGKDIKAVIHAANRPVRILMKWNGMKFDQSQY
ncbi:MAG: hypothetical protein J5797_10365 [Prevotella sp.]|nr:hypothetical protein [Prevotella sp.]